MLAIDTATERIGVAIGDAAGVVASFHSTRERHHAEAIAPAIDFLCSQLGIDIDGIDIVGVDIGPGFFTGVRVGIATAKAIAYARGIPVVGISSLDLLALGLGVTDRRIVSAIDTRRGEVYFASYRKSSKGLERLGEPSASAPSVVAEQIAASKEDCIVVGSGGQRFAHLFENVRGATVAEQEFIFPSAVTLVAAAAKRALRGEAVAEAALEPMYLRASYARESTPDDQD